MLVIVNAVLKLFEGEYGLTEGLDDRNTAHILDGLARHIGKRVLVLGHLALHFLAGHAGHADKTQYDRNQTEQAESPIECNQQHDQTGHRSQRACLVRQLMRQIGLCRACRLGDDAAQLAAAELLHRAHRQGDNVLGERNAQVGCDAECRQMRTHQRRNVHQNRNDRVDNGAPAVSGDVNRLLEMRCHVEHLCQYPPEIPERHQRQQCADRRQHPRQVCQHAVSAGIFQQTIQIGLFFLFH